MSESKGKSRFKAWFWRTTEELSYWLLFVLVLSLAPLVYSVWKISNTHDEKELGSIIESVIQHGELVLVCVCLLGAVIGDLIRSNTKWRISRIVFGGLAVALFFFATNAFADIAIATASVTCPL